MQFQYSQNTVGDKHLLFRRNEKKIEIYDFNAKKWCLIKDSPVNNLPMEVFMEAQPISPAEANALIAESTAANSDESN